ncbi:hypothetical protein RHSIM_Rhsim05G0109400 [Rhododendron simsii]|uniref:Trimethylguanosine synthase n=1 Tax=Rhododendron simsii TaxID=118357 RepID=A0A834H026_RHOSS|nr:hypothetical protein RHSIM_Rhsim05G0109400 [Rhododendron simsii]
MKTEVPVQRKIRRSRRQRKLAKRRVKKRAKKQVKEEGVSPLVEKYWLRRYDLFSKYDEGVKLDEEGWFSVTPEEIAVRHAERSGGGVVVDCFAGVGGNSIQFAKMCYHVVAIDIDPQKVEMALSNAKVYGVEDYVDFIVGDFIQLAPSLKITLSREALVRECYAVREQIVRYSLFQIAQTITPNIIMFLPRNVDLLQVEELSWLSSPPLCVEIEKNYLNGYLKGITVYFGDAAFGKMELS